MAKVQKGFCSWSQISSVCRCVYINVTKQRAIALQILITLTFWMVNIWRGRAHTEHIFAFTVLLLHCWKNVLDKHVWEVRGHYLNAMREQINKFWDKVFIRYFYVNMFLSACHVLGFIVFFMQTCTKRWVLCLLQCLAHGMQFYKKWSSSKTLKTKKHAEALCFFVPLPCTPLLF